MLPLCFVLMPFGKKPDASNNLIDFDLVYRDLIAPAIVDSQLEPLRADEEQIGGIIHKPMFERLILCPFAVADLTLANANVYYELGVRHAARPYSTIAIVAENSRLLFDLNLLRAIPYKLQSDGTPADLTVARNAITSALIAAKSGTDDSPVFQLVDLPWRGQLDDLAHSKTDAFRERVRYSEDRKQQLAQARNIGSEEIRRVEQEVIASAGSINNEELGVVFDLFLSYRAVKAWPDMIRLYDDMSRPMAAAAVVQEQLALALNRQAGDLVKQGNNVKALSLRDRATSMLNDLITRHGPSSETNGILGRIYKDCWDEARKTNEHAARGFLRKATEAYLKGFEADWRDAYPGINAITLMDIANPPDERRLTLLPVVSYSVERKIASKVPDYWDYATRLELAVLAKDQDRAESNLDDALANQREIWEPETTSRNIGLIREARAERGENVDWLVEIENQLNHAAKGNAATGLA